MYWSNVIWILHVLHYQRLTGSLTAGTTKSMCRVFARICKQYISDLVGVLDRHAPLICRRAKKTPAGWLSDLYRRAKSIRRQFEHMWCKDRSQLSRRRLYRQIGWCNAIINRDKAEYNSTIINDNSDDPMKLWHVLRHVLNKGHEMTLPPHQSEKAVFSSGCVSKKIKKVVVTPLIKKTSPASEDLQNYQLVSGLCFMSKLVERVVVKQIM